MNSPTVWCPSCGAEYVAGSVTCAECRVMLVTYRPPAAGTDDHDRHDDDDYDDEASDLVEMGEWPRLSAQILRRRLESAGIPVMVEWSGTAGDASGTLVVPAEHSDFAHAVITEIDVDDEVPDTSPIAYLARIEEHLAAAAGLLDELRTRLDQLEAGGRL